MEVDVVTDIEIALPRTRVAEYAADPDNATTWYRNIKRVDWKSKKPLQVGSQIAFVAAFLGRTIAYTYEVKEFVPGQRLVMATSEGPFAMETTYSWQDVDGGGTKMTLRNRGRPSGFGQIAGPMIAAGMRRANAKDLSLLKQVLERKSDSST